jgi:hypothetical protein
MAVKFRPGIWGCVGLSLVISGCTLGSPHSAVRVATTQRPHIVPAPAGLVAITQVQADGSLWTLSGSATVKTLTRVDVASGAVLARIGVSNAATTLVQSYTGILVLGSSTPSAGSLEVRNGTTGAIQKTIAVSGPVIRMALSPDGATLFALDGTATVRAVEVVNLTTGKTTASIPVDPTTVAIEPTPGGPELWLLGQDGTLVERSISTPQVLTQFGTGAQARALAISPDGSRIYVLRAVLVPGTAPGVAPNVAVVDVATEKVTKALPAPANALDIAISQDGRTLYDGVGTPTLGNVQAFSLAG